ncbi:hypothetical protein [Sphingomonas sp. Leaf25]|uniref:hypothetical protein n=1 Tax=Sphingomonas sp. Leaf25 TaxID=1735692 RepID=UPI0012E12CA6|nr:hypothetical protein [Sphingomonas sp. Leaf25]
MRRKPVNPKSQAIADRHRRAGERRRLRELGRHVVQRGYTVGRTEYDGIDLFYSIGFPRSLGQGDVVTADCDDVSPYELIEALVDQCRAGLRMVDGFEVVGLIAGRTCVLRLVHADYRKAELFAEAIDFRVSEGFSPEPDIFQLILPDPTCSQPALYQPRQAS